MLKEHRNPLTQDRQSRQYRPACMRARLTLNPTITDPRLTFGCSTQYDIHSHPARYKIFQNNIRFYLLHTGLQTRNGCQCKMIYQAIKMIFAFPNWHLSFILLYHAISAEVLGFYQTTMTTRVFYSVWVHKLYIGFIHSMKRFKVLREKHHMIS